MQSFDRLFAESLSTVSAFCSVFTFCFGKNVHSHNQITDKTDSEKPAMPFIGYPTQRQYQSFAQWPDPPAWHNSQEDKAQRESQEGPIKPPRRSLSLSIRKFAVKKSKKQKLRGRPFISAPSNFRHLHHETVDTATALQHPRRAPIPSDPNSFRRLELDMHLPSSEHLLSPFMPIFNVQPATEIAPLPPAQLPSQEYATIVHQKSSPSMSFHLPRRGTAENLSMASGSEYVPSPPPKSKARTRAYTTNSREHILERIASAMLEKQRLQEQIDIVVERQSIYSNSRPSTAHGLHDLEPMPSIPALPPTEGLTFAERVSTPAPLAPQRPRTAPLRPSTPVSASSNVPLPPASGRSPAHISLPTKNPFCTAPARTPPPPLPLVLRPPLRKKKSFSRVSNWLFPRQESRHSRSFSNDSITNAPRPVKGSEGFYQCVAPTTASGSGRGWGRMSFDSVSSVSTWKSDTYSEEGVVPTFGTAASTWSSAPTASPSSSRVARSTSGVPRSDGNISIYSVPQRKGTFGSAHGHRKEIVGVAL